MPIVNYVREHERFIEYAADEELTASDRCLWYALMHIFNQRANGNDWPGDFIPVKNSRLFTYFPGGFDTLVRSRNRLKQKKLIDFRAGNRNQAAPMYKILYFCPENTDKTEFYPQNTDNIQDNIHDNIGGNIRDNIHDNIGYQYINQKGNGNRNQNDIDTHTNGIVSNPRTRMSGTYLDAKGREQPCRFDGAFQVSERARMAVAQRILDQFCGDMDAEDAHSRLCDFLHDGMPPEIMEDEISNYTSLRRYLAAMAGIFHGRHYEEKRDALEMRRCMEDAKGNPKMAKFLYKCSGRFVPEEEQEAGGW